MLFVDDGSRDGTEARLGELRAVAGKERCEAYCSKPNEFKSNYVKQKLYGALKQYVP